jgi:hypothetical protein
VTRPLAALLLLLAPIVPWSQSKIDERAGRFRPQEEILFLWSSGQVKRLLPGFDGLAADVYWLRTVQYFGRQRLYSRRKDFALLRPLIEITTDLDPRLEIAYRYGAIFLSEPPPEGAGRPREGIEVLEKGTRALPESWRLRQDLGFFHFLYLGEARQAAAILEEASKLPGAAFWLRTLAADLLERGGDRSASREMWQRLFDQAEKGVLRENARLWLDILDSRDRADQVTHAVREFGRRHGRLPRNLEELRRSGLWRGPLTDLAGVPFHYDASRGRVSIARESPHWRPAPGGRR